jgi:hypothetical protein
MVDSTVTDAAKVEAGAMVDAGATSDGSDEAGCKIPARVPSDLAGCTPNLHGATSSTLCNSSQYELDCRVSTASGVPVPAGFLGCVEQPVVDPAGGVYYCCPCESAGTRCVDVDLSTYDRSCSTASDCVEVTSGMVCPGACRCGNAAINATGSNRYWQVVAPLQLGLCNCPDDQGTHCIQGKCAHCPGDPGCYQ